MSIRCCGWTSPIGCGYCYGPTVADEFCTGIIHSPSVFAWKGSSLTLVVYQSSRTPPDLHEGISAVYMVWVAVNLPSSSPISARHEGHRLNPMEIRRTAELRNSTRLLLYLPHHLRIQGLLLIVQNPGGTRSLPNAARLQICGQFCFAPFTGPYNNMLRTGQDPICYYRPFLRGSRLLPVSSPLMFQITLVASFVVLSFTYPILAKAIIIAVV